MIFEDAHYDDGLEMQRLVERLARERNAAWAALRMCLSDCPEPDCASCVRARDVLEASDG